MHLLKVGVGKAPRRLEGSSQGLCSLTLCVSPSSSVSPTCSLQPPSHTGPQESASQAMWMWVVNAGFSSLAAPLPLLSWSTDLYSPAQLEVWSK